MFLGQLLCEVREWADRRLKSANLCNSANLCTRSRASALRRVRRFATLEGKLAQSLWENEDDGHLPQGTLLFKLAA